MAKSANLGAAKNAKQDEFYTQLSDIDKEIGHRAIANSGVFEKRLGLTAAPFDAKKASGLRFYKAGHPIKGHQDAWPGYIEEQLGWALEMKRIIAEIEL